jgi:hypothetical protein
MAVVTTKPLPPPIDPYERVFEESGVGQVGYQGGADTSDPSVYEYVVKAMIDDAKSYEDGTLAPAREENLEYFYGDKPAVENVDEEGTPTSSTVVSTDVRDTVMGIIPSLMRIFTSPEHIVFCSPNYEGQEELAKQQTDTLEYIFWEDNPGFLFLHDSFKDALTTKTCVAYWYTDTDTEVVTQEYANISQEQIQMLIAENESVEIVDQVPHEFIPGIFATVVVRWTVDKPVTKLVGVPLDEFRVARNAKSVDTATLIGFQTTKRKGELIAAGYDEEIINQYTGATRPYSPDRIFRNEGLDETNPLEDYEVDYGEYFVRIDKDGDGIEELRKICTIGDSHYILDDYPVQWATFAVGCPDPRSHTLIGDCPSDLVQDIQRIKTNMLRGALDSLAQSIWPRTVFNELLVNVDDVLNEEIGAAIRTKGTPQETLMSISHQFVGQPVFQMFEAMERLRQVRTGISDASKGLDPKALQSTALTGVDAIITGAQERIELIARLMAETYIKPIFKGLLREITSHPNPKRAIQMRGKWANVDPSTYDPTMRISVNPTLGKGSDMTRLMALQEVKTMQLGLIEKFGLDNPMCGIEEFANTMSDMMAIANVKNTTRYFKAITPEVKAQMESKPKEPDPALLLAQAEMEKRRTDTVKAMSDRAQADKKLRMDDDFRRDQMNVTGMLKAAELRGKFMIDVNQQELEAKNVANETAESTTPQ